MATAAPLSNAESTVQPNPRVVPVLQAGGGNASSAASRGIETFNPVILSHLGKIYASLAHGQSLDKTQTAQFLKGIQQDPGLPATALDKDLVGLNDFLTYMSSAASNALAPPLHHDHSYPLSNYFISTSHNTYLSGNQLYGHASTDAYKNVLLRGCRSLEIDVWDSDSKSQNGSDAGEDETRKKGNRLSGLHSKMSERLDKLKARGRSPEEEEPPAAVTSKESVPTTSTLARVEPWKRAGSERPEPRVLHGHTLTKEITFRAVCHAIRESAFVATDLPIIVSLEVHANLAQQEMMVEIMKEAWQDHLVDITQQSEIRELNVEHLPSPDQLRRKILIKVKWTPNTKTGESNDPAAHVISNSSDDEEELPIELAQEQKEKKKKATKILQELSRLGVYTRAYSFKHFSQPEAKIPTHVFSLSEKKVIDMHEEFHDSLFDHNRNYMMRIFPSGLRINSSNVEPTFLWRQGAQMVALNWQSWDKGMMLNEGMFAGEEGWVLKPDGYRGTLDDKAGSQKQIQRQTLDLTIDLFAGQNLPLPLEERRFGTIHPYVKCQLHVDSRPEKELTTDDKKERSDEKYKRRSKTAKGVDPDFAAETMRFSNVSGVSEELSFVR